MEKLFKSLRIESAQIRADDFIHNGGWYTRDGKKIGWGDLSKKDLKALSEALPPEEILFILPESASFWNFVEELGTVGALCKVSPAEKAPGKEFVAQHMMYAVNRGNVWRIEDPYEVQPDWVPRTTYDGQLRYTEVSRGVARQLFW